MNKKSMEKCIQVAQTLLSDDHYKSKILEKQDKKWVITREVKAKAAAFGPVVYQMGLTPAVAMYSDGSKANSNKVVDVIRDIIVKYGEEDDGFSELLKRVLNEDSNASLLTIITWPMNESTRLILREKILYASVALKLVLRTYPVKKESQEKTRETVAKEDEQS